jgi:hypothetical protein
LGGKRTHGALVQKAVPMLVGALSTRPTAVQTWAARSADDGELLGAERASPMRGARVMNGWHVAVVRQGCDSAVRPDAPRCSTVRPDGPAAGGRARPHCSLPHSLANCQ